MTKSFVKHCIKELSLHTVWDAEIGHTYVHLSGSEENLF